MFLHQCSRQGRIGPWHIHIHTAAPAPPHGRQSAGRQLCEWPAPQRAQKVPWATDSKPLGPFLAPGDQLIRQQASIPRFLVWPVPRPCTWQPWATQQALEHGGRLCVGGVGAAWAAGLSPQSWAWRRHTVEPTVQTEGLPKMPEGEDCHTWR